MSNIISTNIARTQFEEIVRRVSEKNERFVIGRNGEPKAVLMSMRDFIDTIAPPPEWLQAIWAEAKHKGTDKLTMREINDEIAATRKERYKKQTPKTSQR